MGTWGTGIYSSDIAEDVKEICKEIFPFVSVKEGNEIIFNEFEELIGQNFIDNDYASFWYALADWQWNHGILDDEIKIRTIELLEAHAGLADWQESASQSDMKKRCAILDKLLLKLNTAQPDIRLPKASLAKPKHKKGDIIIFQTCGMDKYEIWRIKHVGVGFQYVLPYIRESSDVLPESFNAFGKYLAILCIGTKKRLHSDYLADLYDENSVYAFYDYCDSREPSLEMLKHCGFLPAIIHSFDSASRKFERMEWIYQFTTSCSFRLNDSYGIEKFQKLHFLGEAERFHSLLKQKNYSDNSSWCGDLYHSFSDFFQEKLRLLNLNIKIDTLLDVNICNPELLAEADMKDVIQLI